MAKPLARSASNDIASGPSRTAFAITPNDATLLTVPAVWVDVTTGGTVSFLDGLDQPVSLTVPDGYSIKCVVQRINATGTTASGFIGYP
ncbi:hypothetical protein M2336_001667 [Sphingobium sp. B1D7B]|uniref:spike base protein, RCAP_Rcc01079 family n=1 Tax=Sphingobium sp. B1D7B TaxID=2940578 RepID=UPI0022245FA8|nr:hypothetical protein [Sphingobium sp. B1D7B]MCW2405038.1 hypothetical protein [Sphingobium sp. B1D7B]